MTLLHHRNKIKVASLFFIVILFLPISAFAKVGDSCIAEDGCEASERCELTVTPEDTPCLAHEQCQQVHGAQAKCILPEDCDDPLSCPQLRKCVTVEGACALIATPTNLSTGVALPTLDVTTPDPQIDIPDLKFAEPVIVPDEDQPEKFVAIFPWIGQYIKAVYIYLLGIAGLVAVIVFIHAGFEWMASGGNAHAVESAKKRIFNASIGLVILFGSYTILNAINPRLTRFEGIKVSIIKRVELDLESMENDVNPDGGFDIEGTPGAGFRDTWLYKQAAPQWRGVAYGNLAACEGGKDPGGASPGCCSSYAYAGCGPTSLAMVLRTHGVATSPVDTGALATSIGARKCNNGTTGELFKEVDERWDNFKGRAVTHEVALKILSAKTTMPIIASTPRIPGCYKKGGHWIVLTGVDEEGVIRVNDPATGKCFAGRDAGDGFYGSKGAGLTGMAKANFLRIPVLYIVIPKDKIYNLQNTDPALYETLSFLL